MSGEVSGGYYGVWLGIVGANLSEGHVYADLVSQNCKRGVSEVTAEVGCRMGIPSKFTSAR